MLVKIDKMLKIDFIALSESKMIQLQFATNRIKIGPLEVRTLEPLAYRLARL